MSHPVAHVLDTVIVGGMAAVTAASAMMLATPDPVANTVELQLFLLPLLGAMIVSGGMIMLNPNPEVRRIVIGRGIFALFFGVLLPQVIGMFHPALQSVSVKPAILVLMGGGISGIAYVLSKPFCSELYKRAEGVAKREAARLEQKYSPIDPPTTKLTP